MFERWTNILLALTCFTTIAVTTLVDKDELVPTMAYDISRVMCDDDAAVSTVEAFARSRVYSKANLFLLLELTRINNTWKYVLFIFAPGLCFSPRLVQ